jgi:hypothetical protein
MKTKSAKIKSYRSFEEFEMSYFPKSRQESEEAQLYDSDNFGMTLAKQSIAKIKKQLSK